MDYRLQRRKPRAWLWGPPSPLHMPFKELAATSAPQQPVTVPPVVWLAGIGALLWATSRWWVPWARKRARVLSSALVVLGSGALVAGLMDSDSAAGAIGAMMLVGGLLAWKTHAQSTA